MERQRKGSGKAVGRQWRGSGKAEERQRKDNGKASGKARGGRTASAVATACRRAVIPCSAARKGTAIREERRWKRRRKALPNTYSCIPNG